MKPRNILLILATLVLIVGLSVVAQAGPAAQGPGAGSGITTTGTVASKISYQGRLTDAAGNPLTGSYNLVFQLWNDAAAGSQVGGDIVKNAVPVSNGLFTVDLDVPQNAFDGKALWLRIQVSGQWLSPRQELLPVPYALSLRPGAWVTGDIQDDAILWVTNLRDTPQSTGIGGVGYVGVYGQSGYTGVPASTGVGVQGNAYGTNGKGVYGKAEGSGSQAYGVFAESNYSYAIFADTIVGTYGLYTPDKIYAGGGCVGCTSLLIARNGGEETLEPGDVVAVTGITAPLSPQGKRPVIVVRKADAASGQAVVGVVEGRYIFELVSADGRVVEWARATDEPAAPGEYLTIVERGLALVKVDATPSAIEVGDGLGPVAMAGHVQKLSQGTAAPAWGRALEPLAKGTGLIWVLIVGR